MKIKIILGFIAIFLVGSFIYSSSIDNVDLKYGDSVNVSSYQALDTSKSSFVDSAKYNPGNDHLILELNGVFYEYCGVPSSVWSIFRQASSFGSYYNVNIKNKYSCQ